MGNGNMIDFKALLSAVQIVNNAEKLKLSDIIKEFEVYSDQQIPQNIVDDFIFTGLSNLDFLTSDYLNKYGIRNLIEVVSTLPR